jgi:Phycobilisome protein
MLKQLAQLSVEAEGRYATDRELQFLKDYLQSAEQRMTVYTKIRNAEEKILHLVEAKKRTIDMGLFQMASKDITQICRRDLTMMLRCTAAAMLFGDLERLREGVLIWYRTIVKAFGYQKYTQVTYQVLQDAVNEQLDSEEVALIKPALQLNHSMLTS